MPLRWSAGRNSAGDQRTRAGEQGGSPPVCTSQASSRARSKEEQSASEAAAGPRRSISMQEMWQVLQNRQRFVIIQTGKLFFLLIVFFSSLASV